MGFKKECRIWQKAARRQEEHQERYGALERGHQEALREVRDRLFSLDDVRDTLGTIPDLGEKTKKRILEALEEKIKARGRQ